MDVIMPQLGETVEEGTVAAWHKKEGDKVAIDELLVEIETDKVATEVPSLAKVRPSRSERSSRSSIRATARAPRRPSPPVDRPSRPNR
jgi:multidrug efflux pump subunit AcrA (membrane-fusion protein)